MNNLQFFFHEGREVAEGLPIFLGHGPGAVVHHAEGADVAPVRRLHRIPRVKPDARRFQDPRVVPKAGIGGEVIDNQRGVLQNSVGAQGGVPRGFGEGQPLNGFEPLAFVVDEGNVGDGHVKGAARQPGDAVEALLGRCVEQPEPSDRLQTAALVVTRWGFVHTDQP